MKKQIAKLQNSLIKQQHEVIQIEEEIKKCYLLKADESLNF